MGHLRNSKLRHDYGHRFRDGTPTQKKRNCSTLSKIPWGIRLNDEFREVRSLVCGHRQHLLDLAGSNHSTNDTQNGPSRKMNSFGSAERLAGLPQM